MLITDKQEEIILNELEKRFESNPNLFIDTMGGDIAVQLKYQIPELRDMIFCGIVYVVTKFEKMIKNKAKTV